MKKADHYLRPDMLADAPRVIVLGGGPSLKNMDPALLVGRVVISSNRAFETFPTGIIITIDGRFHKWMLNGCVEEDSVLAAEARKKWLDYKGLKIFLPDPLTGDCLQDDVVILDRTEACYPPTLNSIGLSTNTGHAALMLAWSLGAKNIWLFGFDMGMDSNGLQQHHHNDYPIKEEENVYTDRYIPEMERAALAMTEAGVKVTVFGPTALQCFPVRPIVEAVPMLKCLKHRPLIVTFYTDDFYEKHAREMQKTAMVMGLDVDVCFFEGHNNWQKNTHKKAGFLLNRLKIQRKAGDTRPLVWVDADARFRAYPTELDQFAWGKDDLCVVYIDWNQFPQTRGGRSGDQLASGVLGLRPTDAVIEVLEKWVEMNKTTVYTKILEQKNLQVLLDDEECSVKVMQLSMSYCQIYDQMEDLGVAVIEQMQASRKWHK